MCLNNNLYSRFSQLNNSFYYIKIDSKNLFSDSYKIKCREFINKHFKSGKKAEALNFPWSKQYLNDGKHIHTVSLYLMGLSLFENTVINDCLNKKLAELIPNISLWYDFKYTWFLTCLYHDAASCVEKSSICSSDLGFYKGKFNLQYTPYNHKPLKNRVSLTRFSEELIKNYFAYRVKCGSVEHGIIAGYYLFDSLYKNFIEVTKTHDFSLSSVYNNGLSWRLEHLDHFAYISDAIICHNIWLSSNIKTNQIYRENGLSPLIVNNKRTNRLSFKEYPLQFILCLLDTLEPTKRLNDMNAADVLNSISIDKCISDSKCQLKISWCDSLNTKAAFNEWKKGLSSLAEWLCIQKDFENNNSIDFSFNFK